MENDFPSIRQKKSTFPIELLDDNNNPIKLLYTKDELWLKHFGHSNLLCMRALKAIVNHMLIGECWLNFFLGNILSAYVVII